jgi:glyoxylase-like metal-dependent hydrolase (beta-lactamase superfamily II)
MRRFLLLFVLVAAGTAAAQDSEVSFTSEEISPGIYMIYGVGGFAGGNVGLLVGNDHVAVIDDSMKPLAPKLAAHILELTDRSIDFMVNTHVHGDHVGGNALFAKNGTVVFAHENIRKRLLADPAPAGGPDGLPVVTFDDGVTFYLDGIEARVIHVPSAHTDGDSIIHFPAANVIHSGDVVFHAMFPFIDLDSGGSVDGYIAAQRAVLETADDDTKIIPGHGALTDRAGLETDLAMLVDSRDRVKALVEGGASEDDVLAANPLADYHDAYNWSFITTERMTRTLYRDLTTNQ